MHSVLFSRASTETQDTEISIMQTESQDKLQQSLATSGVNPRKTKNICFRFRAFLGSKNAHLIRLLLLRFYLQNYPIHEVNMRCKRRNNHWHRSSRRRFLCQIPLMSCRWRWCINEGNLCSMASCPILKAPNGLETMKWLQHKPHIPNSFVSISRCFESQILSWDDDDDVVVVEIFFHACIGNPGC